MNQLDDKVEENLLHFRDSGHKALESDLATLTRQKAGMLLRQDLAKAQSSDSQLYKFEE